MARQMGCHAGQRHIFVEQIGASNLTYTFMSVEYLGDRVTLFLDTRGPAYEAYDGFMNWLEEVILSSFLEEIGCVHAQDFNALTDTRYQKERCGEDCQGTYGIEGCKRGSWQC
jgi:hypothetical protein